MTSVIVLGAGPAGLLAAWGAERAGATVAAIIDPDPTYKPGRIFSLQYLHERCNLPCDEVRALSLSYDVTPLGYRNSPEHARHAYNAKLGRYWNADNSTRFLYVSPVEVTSLKDAYHFLWGRFRERFMAHAVPFDRLERYAATTDLLISTVPLPVLRPDLEWPTRDGLIAMDWLPDWSQAPNTCVYNLDEQSPWYRATNLDNGFATEFLNKPHDHSDGCSVDVSSPPICADGYPYDVTMKMLRKVEKAPDGQLDRVREGLPVNVLFAGRWGTWEPSMLTHHAYRTAFNAVSRG